MSDVELEEAIVEDKPPRIQAIWLLPIVVLIVGIYVVVQTYLDQGPQITITFETATGLQAGKTQLKALSVEIGLVEEVVLADDLSHVIVTAQMNPGTAKLLREDTQIWVERARVGAAGISGLSTVLSGAYVEVSPGTGAAGKRKYVGLEQVPTTAPGVPGVRINLYSDRANSVSTGDPLLYRGFKVGKVEQVKLDLKSSQIHYTAFIDAPYDSLVTAGTRFWNASGLDIEAGANGIRVQSGSLTSLISGGVAFDVPDIADPGEPVASGASFRLYADKRSSETNPYEFYKLYVAQFEQSLRGLNPGAPVEYRGIQVGTVERILIDELSPSDGQGQAVPVLIRAEPGRFGLGDSAGGVQLLEQTFRRGISNGLRANVQTGNLLTGSLFISLDHYPDEELEDIGEYAGYPTVPTISSGLQRLERQVATLLEKVNALPLDDTVNELNSTVHRARQLLGSIDKLVKSEAVQALPARLESTLGELEVAAGSFSQGSDLYGSATGTLFELQQTLQSVRTLVQKLEDKPNTILFSPAPQADPIPGGS